MMIGRYSAWYGEGFMKMKLVICNGKTTNENRIECRLADLYLHCETFRVSRLISNNLSRRQC